MCVRSTWMPLSGDLVTKIQGYCRLRVSGNTSVAWRRPFLSSWHGRATQPLTNQEGDLLPVEESLPQIDLNGLRKKVLRLEVIAINQRRFHSRPRLSL